MLNIFNNTITKTYSHPNDLFMIYVPFIILFITRTIIGIILPVQMVIYIIIFRHTESASREIKHRSVCYYQSTQYLWFFYTVRSALS